MLELSLKFRHQYIIITITQLQKTLLVFMDFITVWRQPIELLCKCY